MNLKIQYLTIICAILLIKSEIKAQTARCVYNNKYFWTRGYTSTNETFYSCNLDTRRSNINKKIIRIEGQHLIEQHEDNDVKYITNYVESKFLIFSSIFCQKFQNLEIIAIKNARVEVIDGNSLQNCKNLVTLWIDSSNICEIPQNLLSQNSKLTRFWFKNNQLTTLNDNFFVNQKELEQLDLHGNQIGFLPGGIFKNLVKLQDLYLTSNKLPVINPKWFENLLNLKWLSLSRNKITSVPSDSFSSLSTLEKLWLYSNKITNLYPGSFNNLQNLKILSLHGNDISDLQADIFSPLTNLIDLDISSNKLSTIHSDSFGFYNNLINIRLQENKINSIDEKFIDNVVKVINMTSNICSQSLLTNRQEMKLNLTRCFNNYQPRQIQHPTKPQFNPQQQNLQARPQFSNQVVSSSCGKAMAGQGNIIGGTQITRGSFPWIAALISSNGDFFCGGTIISSRKVITASHCMQDKHEVKPKSAGDFLVLLGAHNLNKTIEVGRVPYAVQKVNIHPDWNIYIESFDADIAVLVLDRAIGFNEFIQPICLVNVQATTVITGIVVGYGKSEDETKIHENIPKVIDMPIHTNEHCFLENSNLVKISSKRTFCGGTGTGVGVCRGDSGSGLFVTDGSAYYLRGIVSSSIIGGRYGCDVDTYSVFTDVTKYVDWINGISTNRFE